MTRSAPASTTEIELSEGIEIVPDTEHEGMYLLAARNYDIFDFLMQISDVGM